MSTHHPLKIICVALLFASPAALACPGRTFDTRTYRCGPTAAQLNVRPTPTPIDISPTTPPTVSAAIACNEDGEFSCTFRTKEDVTFNLQSRLTPGAAIANRLSFTATGQLRDGEGHYDFVNNVATCELDRADKPNCYMNNLSFNITLELEGDKLAVILDHTPNRDTRDEYSASTCSIPKSVCEFLGYQPTPTTDPDYPTGTIVR